MKLGIFGDSFGVPKDEDRFPGWPELLRNEHTVENFCQCGASQYRILKQLTNIDLSGFDRVIVTHTSYSRIFVQNNPLHSESKYHKNCDIILSDVENFDNEFSKACQLYFKHIYDDDYQKDMHNMICCEIDNRCGDRAIHITHFDYSDLYRFPTLLNFYSLWKDHRGPVNHYDEEGNQIIYKQISMVLNHG